uniref:Uncharacterized protein n=1 Tax=Tanacetum cinerariifolium TaxID=118510 RepID=A0A699JM10_TANCI|nr:hypothetical protein [Tanacetum cinerariifolium]
MVTLKNDARSNIEYTKMGGLMIITVVQTYYPTYIFHIVYPQSYIQMLFRILFKGPYTMYVCYMHSEYSDTLAHLCATASKLPSDVYCLKR